MQPRGVQGAQARGPECEAAGGGDGEAVDVLVGTDELTDGVAVERLGHGQLAEDAVDGVVGVELLDQGLDLGLGGARGQVVAGAEHADLLAAAVLARDVDLRGGVLADEHGGETWHTTEFGRERRDLLLDRRAPRGGDGLAVENESAHRPHSPHDARRRRPVPRGPGRRYDASRRNGAP